MAYRGQSESEDERAYQLLQDLNATDLLKLEVEKPTVEYMVIKKHFMDAKPNIHIEPLEILEIWKHNEWSGNPQQVDVLIWTEYANEYLPYVYGSFDGRNHGINTTKMSYTDKTFYKGIKLMITKLERIYKVIKFKNPTLLSVPKKIQTIDWRDKCTKENAGNVRYYYRWSDVYYTVNATRAINSAVSPSFHHVNLLQEKQPPYHYVLEEDDEEYVFVFLPATKQPINAVDGRNSINLTHMLTGNYFIRWPLGLKKVCFPMIAVETMDYPLFKYLIKDKLQRNRSLNYYVLKEEMYYDYLYDRIGLEDVPNMTIQKLAEIQDTELRETSQVPELMYEELQACKIALINWEDYE